MRVDILSLFPHYFSGPFGVSILKRAREKGLLDINLIDIRDFAENKHSKVDDRPFGGGPGMVLTPGPVIRAIDSVRQEYSHVIYLSPQGSLLNAAKGREIAQYEHLILLCGHYEGIDQRALDLRVNEEISIGDYILTNGCISSIVLVDVVSRFIPGVLGHPEAAQKDSLENGLFEGPMYTRPESFEGKKVPDILRDGHHAKIEDWRSKRGAEKTKMIRPDLYEQFQQR